MPELPEVESTVRRLCPQVLGRKIVNGHIGWKNMIPGSSPELFLKTLKGGVFEEPFRRGKYIIIPLLKGKKKQYFILHQKMSGRTKLFDRGEERSKHDHVVVVFDNKEELRMTDPRKFGRAYIVDDPEEVVAHLGPEPLAEDFSKDDFITLFQKKKGTMKPLLLSQEFIAGLGNIYVDETLWAARVHPLRKADTLVPKEHSDLYKYMRQILRKAIDSHGTDFGDGVIYGGKYRPKAYGREGERCSRCKTTIERIVVAARSTHFCPVCQKE